MSNSWGAAVTEAFRYAAFISYSSADDRFARRLHRALERYGIPTSLGKFDLVGRGKKNRVYPVFRDREELAAGDLGDRIEAALRTSGALIVVCSRNAAASPWVQKEIEFFVSLGRSDRIFAVIADNAPLVGDNGADATRLCFPPALQGDDLKRSDAIEPLAADAREGKDGFRNAWLKLVAGLIGITPGQLIDRDKRVRRQNAAKAAAIAILAVLGVVVAYTQREVLEAWRISATRYRPFVDSNDSLSRAAAGTPFQDCRDASEDCPVMVVLPSGSFIMGSPEDDPDAAPDERPLHEVSIRRLAVSRSEITFAEWKACTDAGYCRGQTDPSDAGWGRGQRPVINVSWNDAREYTDWLSRMTGERYRLLSEAEWEYAARGNAAPNAHRWRFSWGDAEPTCDSDLPNGAAYSACGERRTWEVRSFPANAFGLHDMHGNVWEWVQDCYAEQLDLSTPGGEPVEADGCRYRVLRGGAWDADPRDLRSANRIGYVPTDRGNDVVGFRVARMLQ